MAEEQFELDLPVPEDIIFYENLTATADSVLAYNIGKHRQVFLIGIDADGFPSYFSNHPNAIFWSFALERARNFILQQVD